MYSLSFYFGGREDEHQNRADRSDKHSSIYPRVDFQPGDIEYEKLRGSIEEFGYVEPIVWNERTGHMVGGISRA